MRKMQAYSFRNNIWPFVIGTSDCSSEFLAAWRKCQCFYSSRHLGHFLPEQSDILIVYGHVNKTMRERILDIHQRMPEGKKVMLVGSHTFESGFFKGSYWSGVQLSDHIEVDVCIPGDPPSTEDILTGFQEISRIYHEGQESQ